VFHPRLCPPALLGTAVPGGTASAALGWSPASAGSRWNILLRIEAGLVFVSARLRTLSTNQDSTLSRPAIGFFNGALNTDGGRLRRRRVAILCPRKCTPRSAPLVGWSRGRPTSPPRTGDCVPHVGRSPCRPGHQPATRSAGACAADPSAPGAPRRCQVRRARYEVEGAKLDGPPRSESLPTRLAVPLFLTNPDQRPSPRFPERPVIGIVPL